MSDSSAIRMLQAAIENVRENCTGPEYKDLLAACDKCDQEAEACVREDAQDKTETPVGGPRDLKGAATRAKQLFADRRNAEPVK